MNKNLNIQEELEALKTVAPLFTSVKRQNGFVVPENYFEKLPGRISKKCGEADAPMEIPEELSRISKENPFAVPGYYFEDLPDRISKKCAESGASMEIPEELSRISKENPFTVPVHYFDNLPARIQEKVQSPAPSYSGSLVISHWSVIRHSQRVWAMAAVLVGIIFLAGGTLYFINQSGTGHKQQLTQITAADLANCTIMYDLDESAIIEHISQNESGTDENEKEAEDYLISNNVDIHSMLNEL